jgi:para-aminobenzoate synthetase component I
MLQPCIEELQTGLTAHEAFRIWGADPSVAFLDSLPGYGTNSRYSIIGINPYQTLRGWPGQCILDGQEINRDPFEVLNRLLEEARNEPIADLPISGGCIGAVAYDAGFGLVELPIPERSARLANQCRPLVSFDFYDHFLIFDHQAGKVTSLACGHARPASASLDMVRQALARRSAELQMKKESPSIDTAGSATNGADSTSVDSLPDQRQYEAQVEAIREQIRQGEVYIANFTHQLAGQTQEPSLVLYERLRALNPAPFAAFIRHDQLEILSASPERFLEIRNGGGTRTIKTCPIKGTRPRGCDANEEERNAIELLSSSKDRAELLMIVDLERNDLSRVCQPDSVKVEDLFRLETYPTVLHLVATVKGTLRSEVSSVDAFKACFPGGSITGAPKVAAMQIIDRLESQPRYLYTGALGYFSLDGQADFNIIIRTIVRQGQKVSYGSGGGITWESDARAEYEEMLLKARSFMQVMGKRG